MDELLSLRKMQIVGWIYLFCATIGSWLVISWSFAWAVFAGGVIAMLSFVASHRDVVGFVESLSPTQQGQGRNEKIKKGKSGFLIKFWFRIGVIGVALLLLIKSGRVNVFGLILGLSTIVFTITFTAFWVAKRYFFSGRR